MSLNEMTKCRMHKNVYPHMDELIVAKITKMDEEGADVELLEYNDIRAHLPITQFTRRGRVRSIRSIVNVGQMHILQVISVSDDTGYIGVSKKTVTDDDAESRKDEYVKLKKIHNILARTAQLHNLQLLNVYEDAEKFDRKGRQESYAGRLHGRSSHHRCYGCCH